MANPTTRWDRIPVFGVWLKIDDTPSPGKVSFGLGQRVTRVDGREIYPEGAQLEVTIGKQDEQDATVRSTVRAAWRAADAAAAGASFDAVAWDTRWDTVIVPAAIFVRFPAADDPDIVQNGYTVSVSERLASGKGKGYSIQPLLSQLDLPVPGIQPWPRRGAAGRPGHPDPRLRQGRPRWRRGTGRRRQRHQRRRGGPPARRRTRRG